MGKTWTVLGLVLLAVLAAAAVLYGLWPSTGRPALEARPAPSPEAAAPAPAQPPPGAARVEFASPVATPRPPAARPAPRSGVARPPSRPDPRVQARSSAPQLSDYLDVVAAEIGDRWAMPKPEAPTDARVPVVLKIGREGQVLWAMASASAGDRAIDASIARMIDDLKRNGLPPLPRGYPYDELDVGLVLRPGAGR